MLSFVCFILFSVAPVLATTATDEGFNNSTNDNNTINNTVVPPTADITADVTDGTAPLKVLFISNCNGSPIGFYWTFGDGTHSNQNFSVAHTYTQPGKYEVLLTVTNVAGSNTATKYINVSANNDTSNNASCISNSAPGTPGVNSCKNNTNPSENNTNPSVNNTKCPCNVSKTTPTNLRVLCSGKAPRRVHFIDRSKRHISWYWDFGDGSTSRSKSITHIYKTPGKYLIKLTYKTIGHYTKTLKGGYIVVKGSSSKATKTPTNSSQTNQTSTPPATTQTQVAYTDLSWAQYVLRQSILIGTDFENVGTAAQNKDFTAIAEEGQQIVNDTQKALDENEQYTVSPKYVDAKNEWKEALLDYNAAGKGMVKAANEAKNKDEINALSDLKTAISYMDTGSAHVNRVVAIVKAATSTA